MRPYHNAGPGGWFMPSQDGQRLGDFSAPITGAAAIKVYLKKIYGS
jgi:hypothetical protein